MVDAGHVQEGGEEREDRCAHRKKRKRKTGGCVTHLSNPSHRVTTPLREAGDPEAVTLDSNGWFAAAAAKRYRKGEPPGDGKGDLVCTKPTVKEDLSTTPRIQPLVSHHPITASASAAAAEYVHGPASPRPGPRQAGCRCCTGLPHVHHRLPRPVCLSRSRLLYMRSSARLASPGGKFDRS